MTDLFIFLYLSTLSSLSRLQSKTHLSFSFSPITSSLKAKSSFFCVIGIAVSPLTYTHIHTQMDSGSSVGLSDLMSQNAAAEDIESSGREVQDGSLTWDQCKDQWASEKQGGWSKYWRAGVFSVCYSTASRGSSFSEAGIMLHELRMDNSLMQMNRQLERPCRTCPVNQKNKGRNRSLISKKIACHHVWLVKSIFPSITCVSLHMPVILVEEFDHTVTPRLCFKEKVSVIHLFLHIENAYWANVRYLVLDVFCSDPPEDLSQGFHASLLLLRTCSQDKLKWGEEILGFSEPRSFLCVVKMQRENLTVRSIPSELWFWFCLVVALHEFLQKLSWDCLAQLNSVTSI